ncbi:TetR/AcrR family transcriptional regulator [Nocardioides carbamazepini]|uniref:TetR/AcrR family transcriptional regulator n=1 Tax=Nocardioides carbamazepini TaxID=2854259 RepID=UPI00214A0528|nr:TetR/AcrR family transcriptional regulator [Nocardioides carbamazepini]MCR1782167.1 TetR/AcrR family transcriptional regulator [Nocardioides carbamazepini]
MTTRDTVLAAAQRLLATDPTASMAQIATAAGVGRATVHRHFASREDLLHEIGRRSLDRWAESMAEAGLAEAVASADPERIRACLDDVIGRFVVDADEHGIALTDPTVVNAPALRERADELFTQEITLYAAAQAAGLLRSDVPARWLGHTVYGLLVAIRDALLAGDIAPRDAQALVRSTFLEGGAVR